MTKLCIFPVVYCCELLEMLHAAHCGIIFHILSSLVNVSLAFHIGAILMIAKLGNEQASG